MYPCINYNYSSFYRQSLCTMAGPHSSYSSLETHIYFTKQNVRSSIKQTKIIKREFRTSWNVDREARILPPIQVEYLPK